MTRPTVPTLGSVPFTVMAGPPGDRVVPLTMIASPFLAGRKAVIVLSPKVKTVCKPSVGVGFDPSPDKEMVRVPSITIPDSPALSCVPSIVIAVPLGDNVVPSMMIAESV